MRDILRDYVNSPFGKVPWQLESCLSHGRERKFTGAISNMKVN